MPTTANVVKCGKYRTLMVVLAIKLQSAGLCLFATLFVNNLRELCDSFVQSEFPPPLHIKHPIQSLERRHLW